MRTASFFCYLLIDFVDGLPTEPILVREQSANAVRAETGALGRLLYGIISIICLCGLSFALGLRVTQFERKKTLQFAWVLSHIQTIVAMMLLISGAILIYGLNFTTWKECRASITVCIFLYFLSKILLYIFYMERVHIARLPVAPKRSRDPIWLAGMVIIVGLFGGMAVWCIATPHANISVQDGQCRIGSDMIPSYTAFSFDIIINIGLTGVFIWLIVPVLKNKSRGTVTVVVDTSELTPHTLPSFGGVLTRDAETDDPLSLSVKRMLRRNIIGSALTFGAAAINLVIYFVDATSQIAYVCYTLCIVDVVFGVLVVQWLTFGRGSNERNEKFRQPPTAANLAMSEPAFITMPDMSYTPSKASQ